METETRPAPAASQRRTRWMQALGIVLFAVTLSLLLFVFRDFFESIGEWGYFGTLLVMLVNNATIIFPALGHAFLIALAGSQTLDPWLLGIAGGVGGALGELTGYVLGRTGHEAMASSRLYERAHRLMKWTGPTLFVFAATPLPFDLAGVLAGSMRYPVWRFMLWCSLGKIIQMCTITVASYYAIDWLYRFFGFA